ncbi:MAG: hypothetical protein QM691_13360 [Opitutaceae bacterium]
MISSLSSSSSAAADFFSRIDTNADGQVSADELKTDFETTIKKTTAATDAAVATPTAPDFATMIASGDADGDGSLSEVEFTTAMQARHQMPPPPPETSPAGDDETSDTTSIEKAISSIDTDGDGKLSAAELAAAHLARTEAAANADDSSVAEDDSASATEMSADTSPDFTSLVALVDSDGDGLLSSDELSTLVSDSRRAQQPPPPPPMNPPEQAWAPDADTSRTTAIGQA